MSLGWPIERVHVIDTDLGQSGATADREGFQRLITDVGLGRAGIVLGLEVSRLARNSTDWHRLVELCALSDTLIVDEDGLYDPAHFNDRLLLGLKGTMSEAELHVLRARLRGGIMSKAKRGELLGPLPIGFVYGPDGRQSTRDKARTDGTRSRRGGGRTVRARSYDCDSRGCIVDARRCGGGVGCRRSHRVIEGVDSEGDA